MNAPLAASLACLCCHAAAAPAAADVDAPAAHLLPTAAITAHAPDSAALAKIKMASAETYTVAVASPPGQAVPRAAAAPEPAHSGTGGRSLAMALALMAGIALRRWGRG